MERGYSEVVVGHFFGQTKVHPMDVREILDQIVAISTARAQAWHQEAERTVADTARNLWTFAVLAVVLALLVALFLSSRITRPINRVAKVLREISTRGGDLTKSSLSKAAMRWASFPRPSTISWRTCMR